MSNTVQDIQALKAVQSRQIDLLHQLIDKYPRVLAACFEEVA